MKKDRPAPILVETDNFIHCPLETIFVEGDWHRDRIVLIEDAAHTMTPHLGQWQRHSNETASGKPGADHRTLHGAFQFA